MVVSREDVDVQLTIAPLNIRVFADREMELPRARIEQARSVFIKMKNLVCHFVRCYGLPVLFYGIEGWTLTKALEKKLEAFEMWLYRHIVDRQSEKYRSA